MILFSKLIHNNLNYSILLMKKALKSSKFSGTSNFVRRVLSKTSNNDEKTAESSTENSQVLEKQDHDELLSLKEQLKDLQSTVNIMQDETDNKQRALASLAREKERLSSDLKKQRRSNVSLKQQLDDEREYYYKEKEQYCQEMHNYKKLKKVICTKTEEQERDSNKDSNYKQEIGRLKTALNQTLEANYNLSVKFLRMKNTKVFLKNKVTTLESERDKILVDFKRDVEYLKNEINELSSKLFELPISPSNKKFMKVVKQNGHLVHENLCLQLEVDHLKEELQTITSKIVRTDSKKMLQYSHSILKNKEKGKQPLETKADETKQKSEKKKKKKNKCIETEERVTKIYEKQETEGTPQITILPNAHEDLTSAKTVVSHSLDLVQVSENPSQTSTESCTYISSQAIRTQSAPEISSSSMYDICNGSKLC